MRTVSVRIWSLAASTTPGATDNGFCLRMRRTSGAGQRRRRCALTNRSMVVSRSRTAFAGVGAWFHKSRNQSAAKSSASSSILRVIAPELLTHAAGQTSAFLLQLVGHPRPLAQLHNHWLVVRQAPKGVPIGAQAVGQHVSVAPVVLGAGHGEAVAEPVELLGIDPIHAKTAFQQGFDDRAVRHFDCHPNDLGRGAGAGNQPITQLLDPRAAMRNGSLAQTLSASIDQANLMTLARPVDTDKPCNLFRHARPSSRIAHIRAAATSVNPCTGARGATSHGTSVAADLPRRRSVSGAQDTGFAGYSR